MYIVRFINLTVQQLQYACALRAKGYAMNPRVQGQNKKRQLASHRVKMILMKT